MNYPEKFYITTAIDYINGKPHIGHSYEKVATDVLARYYASKIGRDQVYFLTGTDEHGAKISDYAKESGLEIEEFANQTSAFFSFAWDQLNLQYDRFVRTTDQDHIQTVEEIISKMKDNGFLYEADYEGLYCTGHEAFITEKDLVNGLCPEHQKAPEKIKEKNWFFKVSSFTKTIKEKIENGEFQIWPHASKNEILSLLEDFKDIAVTRPNVKWGIPVPWEKEQTIYVWVDALINYVSGAGYKINPENYNKYWPADWHVIGRDIGKFHCIIWPAILLAAGLPMPKGVMIHGYLTLNNQKISKSLGNIVDPNDWVAKFGSDPVRYFLMREVAWGDDGDVSEEKLKARYEGELANGWGNLVSRITNLVEKYSEGVVQEISEADMDSLNINTEKFNSLVQEFKFHEALAEIWSWVALANKIVDEAKLWELAKTDTDKFNGYAAQVIFIVTQVAENLLPFMPETSQKILDHLAKEKVTKMEPLFPRIVQSI